MKLRCLTFKIETNCTSQILLSCHPIKESCYGKKRHLNDIWRTGDSSGPLCVVLFKIISSPPPEDDCDILHQSEFQKIMSSRAHSDSMTNFWKLAITNENLYAFPDCEPKNLAQPPIQNFIIQPPAAIYLMFTNLYNYNKEKNTTLKLGQQSL